MTKTERAEYARNYYQLHRETILKKTAEYKRLHPENHRKACRKYRESHREQLCERQRKYRQRPEVKEDYNWKARSRRTRLRSNGQLK
jgi:hypothetical protein